MTNSVLNNCEECGSSYSPNRPEQRFCSKSCYMRAYREASSERYRPEKLACRTSGALSELIVATNLMARGYDVFRALSAQASCDLLIIDGEAISRVEVRTVTRRKDGSIIPSVSKRDRLRCDFYAFVDAERNIHYRDNTPGLPPTSLVPEE